MKKFFALVLGLVFCLGLGMTVAEAEVITSEEKSSENGGKAITMMVGCDTHLLSNSFESLPRLMVENKDKGYGMGVLHRIDNTSPGMNVFSRDTLLSFTDRNNTGYSIDLLSDIEVFGEGDMGLTPQVTLNIAMPEEASYVVSSVFVSFSHSFLWGERLLDTQHAEMPFGFSMGLKKDFGEAVAKIGWGPITDLGVTLKNSLCDAHYTIRWETGTRKISAAVGVSRTF